MSSYSSGKSAEVRLLADYDDNASAVNRDRKNSPTAIDMARSSANPESDKM